MGLTPNEYYSMTPNQFRLAVEGRNKLRKEDYWVQWEHTRQLSYTIAQVNSTKKLPSPEKWMPLPTDKDYKPMTRRDKKSKWEYALNSLKEKKAKGIW